MSYKKKLIEVALPLDAINRASGREKSIRHGHPSSIHLWWARRPLAACRAVLFASLVDDPSSHIEMFPTEESQEKERSRLFSIIEELVKWESSSNEEVLKRAKAEIKKSCMGNLPLVIDPFSGGGSIPLEAQRLGLSVRASDLNPVAVIISKALIDAPIRFGGKNPASQVDSKFLPNSDQWKGAAGLAKDVQYYGERLRSVALKKLSKHYSDVKISGHSKDGLKVIAWLWARTVASPNPAAKGEHVPLFRTTSLSTKKGSETKIEIEIDKKKNCYKFLVKKGKGGKGTVDRSGAKCILTDSLIPLSYIREEGKKGRLGQKLIAVVAETKSGRIYLSPTEEQENLALKLKNIENLGETDLPEKALGFRVQAYGFTTHQSLFTKRQLRLLSTLSGEIQNIQKQVEIDALNSGFSDDGKKFESGGEGAKAYSEAISLYLGLAVSKLADYNSSFVTWSTGRDQARNTFTRQAIPMVWDFAEVNPFAEAAGDLQTTISGICKVLSASPIGNAPGQALQADAAEEMGPAWAPSNHPIVVSTDPPYYDNIGYADLSDFFYFWLRRGLAAHFPSVFKTVLVPKTQELVATPFRFDGDQNKAAKFFEEGLIRAFSAAAKIQDDSFPLTIFYAFKQVEDVEDGEGSDESDLSEGSGEASTGWETMLEGIVKAGLVITSTLPLRTERSARSVANGTNALASSIVLSCRHRDKNATRTTRREFIQTLKRELPIAIRNLQHSGIAAVDLQQAAIGPGMAVYSRYAGVIEADDSIMSVRSALVLINQILDQILAESDSSFDSHTRWAISWFEQFGFNEGTFGDANTLAQAKNVGVAALSDAGIVTSKSGKVALLTQDGLPDDWSLDGSNDVSHWLAMLHLIKRLNVGGEMDAALLVKQLGSTASICRDLAYRCFSICERNGMVNEAISFNNLVTSWGEIQRLAMDGTVAKQTSLPLE